MNVSISYRGIPLFVFYATIVGVIISCVGADLVTVVQPIENKSDLIDRGDAYRNLFMNEAAIDDFTEYINRSTSISHMAYERRAMARFDIGDYEGARSDIRIAMANYPECHCGIRKRGTIKLHFGDYKGAITDFDKAIVIDPGYTQAYEGRALANAKLNNIDAAIKDYDKAISLGYLPSIFNRLALTFKPH